MSWRKPLAEILGPQPRGFPPGFEQQMDQMVERARSWRENNPEKAAEVKINWPRIQVVAAIDDAVDAGIIKVNEPGLELLKALWPWRDTDSPTLSMVRAVLTAIYEQAK